MFENRKFDLGTVPQSCVSQSLTSFAEEIAKGKSTTSLDGKFQEASTGLKGDFIFASQYKDACFLKMDLDRNFNLEN
ncbi:MAG: hypothetical protein ACK5Y2_09415 [Bdellovibrionales bacterium]